MKIAVLAWSSRVAGPVWRQDGPVLPIEFARTSTAVGLIPVLCNEPWVWDVPTLWAASPLDDFDQACRELAVQEGIPITDVGYAKWREAAPRAAWPASIPAGGPMDVVRRRLTQWLDEHHQSDGIDAIIWMGSPATLPVRDTLPGARQAAVEHLDGLPEPNAGAAATYIQQTPVQIWTALRAYLAVERGWTPAPATPPPPIMTGDDLRLKDWQECRTTSGRLDTILEDLRKVGFSLITGLLTASAFLGQNAPDARASAFIAIMVLVAALFSVDTYYQVLLSAAVERALDLEVQTDPPIRVTKYLSINATDSKVGYMTLALYLTLLATACSLGLLATGGLRLAFASIMWWWLLGFVVLLSVLLTPLLLVYRQYNKTAQDETPPDGLLLLMAAGLALWFTGDLGMLLLDPVAKPPPPGVLPWLVEGSGTLLAVYIECYWAYVAVRSGLHIQKASRIWPEGPGKAAAPF